MAKGNPNAIAPVDFRPVAWVEAEIENWIRSRIRGLPWVPAKEICDSPRLIRRPEVLRRVGLSYPTIWALERDGKFPPRVKLTALVVPIARPSRGRQEAADGE